MWPQAPSASRSPGAWLLDAYFPGAKFIQLPWRQESEWKLELGVLAPLCSLLWFPTRPLPGRNSHSSAWCLSGEWLRSPFKRECSSSRSASF